MFMAFAVFFVIICLIIIINRNNKQIDNNLNTNEKKSIHVKTPLGNVDFTRQNEEQMNKENISKEKFLDNLPDDMKEKILKGYVKITDKVNKKVIKYQNGEKISEEESVSSNVIDKKAIKRCPNCGASLDGNLDECMYCKTKIN